MNDPIDIVDRLRQLGSGVVGTISGHHCSLVNEAAVEIDRLRAQLTQLQADVHFEVRRTPEPEMTDDRAD